MFKEYRKFMGYLVLTIVILAFTAGGLKYLGVFGERVVFEQSFQYKEGMKQRANTLEAQIAEVDMQISLNPDIADQLRAQRKVLEIQLKGTKQ
ncbi:MAG: hypothetical protein QM489_00420 [Candidatus Izemoplasma sp.]